MNVHILQHVAFEGPGIILEWLHKHKANITYSHLYLSDPLPVSDHIDLLIIMGGPMSVNDETIYPWLVEEKQFVRRHIAEGKPVVGICLGAQLIASSLGSRVYQGKEKEIGWFPIKGTTTDSDYFQFPAEMMSFHWHGETFDLPEDSVRLASSELCENQAFQLAKNVIGLQFHLEATPETVAKMIEHCSDELVTGEYIQNASAMQQTDCKIYKDANLLMFQIMDYLV